MPGTDETERMRLNRMAAALYMTCQGNLFLLSGEEFARTKDGLEDSYNASIALNRLDWEQAWKNRDLVEYYKGLIALRSRLPGLYDKSPHAAERIRDMEKSEGLVSFAVDNRSEDGHDRWDMLRIIYNSSSSVRNLPVGDGAWEILCSGEDSSLWRTHNPAGKSIQIEPQSVLVLGRASGRRRHDGDGYRGDTGETDKMGIKWRYGKQDWKTLERGQENCYLMTNGLGGFSSLTVTGSAARNDHAFLMACTKAPNNRYNVIHRLAEKLDIGNETYILSSQEFADGTREEGYRYQTGFSYEDTPVWQYLVNGVEIAKEAAIKQKENTAAVCYRIKNRSRSAVSLTVTPFYQFAPKGEEPAPKNKVLYTEGCVESGGMKLYYMTDGCDTELPETEEIYYYAYDECDGRRSTGRAKACHRITMTVESGCENILSVVFSTEDKYVKGNNTAGQIKSVRDLAESVIDELKKTRRELEVTAGLEDETARCLVKSAHQFVSRRESTGGETILAGFPFFEDWGRDTMIALPGICLSTKRYEDAVSILRTQNAMSEPMRTTSE